MASDGRGSGNRHGRPLVSAALLGVALVLGAAAAGCGVAGPGSAAPATSTAGAISATVTTGATVTTDSNGMRPGVFPSTRVEPPAGAPPIEGAAVTPDSELSAAELSALIRLPASAPAAPGRCEPKDVRLSMFGFDAATGHRYSAVLAVNVGERRCTLLGWPGLGFRGANGTAFDLVAEHDETPSDRVGAVPHDPAEPVVLAPGGEATADIEWTGSLAGAYDERVSLIAVQLASGSPAGAIVIPDDEPVDIGEGTTVRVRQWAPAPPDAS